MKSIHYLAATLLGASLLLLPSAQADEASRRAQVEKLLLEMNMDATVNSMYDQMEQMLLDMQQQLNVTEAERPIFEDFTKKFTATFRQELNWQRMKEPLIDIYVKHYTDKEIADMAAFYASETGRSMVAKMPQVMQESMMSTQSMAQSLLPKMEALQTELAQKLQAERAKNSNKPSK